MFFPFFFHFFVFELICKTSFFILFKLNNCEKDFIHAGLKKDSYLTFSLTRTNIFFKLILKTGSVLES